jgi:hypothetical protein
MKQEIQMKEDGLSNMYNRLVIAHKYANFPSVQKRIFEKITEGFKEILFALTKRTAGQLMV